MKDVNRFWRKYKDILKRGIIYYYIFKKDLTRA
jgi:hypothetical protein